MRWLMVLLLAAAQLPAAEILAARNATGYPAPAGEVAPRSLAEIYVSTPDPDLAGTLHQIDWTKPVTLSIHPDGATDAVYFAGVLPSAPFSLPFLATLPADLPLGPAEIRLSFNDGEMHTGHIQVVATSFELFRLGPGSGVPALAQNVASGAEPQTNGLTTPVRAGDYLTLWGTGLGDTPQDEVRVWLGGEELTVTYAGPSPEYDDIDQLNAMVAGGAPIPDGCYVELTVEVAGVARGPATVSKTGGGEPCEHPLGLSLEQMARLDAGGTTPVGSVGIYNMIGPVLPESPVPTPLELAVGAPLTRNESARADFLEIDAAGIAVSSRMSAPGELGCTLSSSIGGGIGVIRAAGSLDVGEYIRLTGPDGRMVDLTSDSPFHRYDLETEPPEPVSDPADLPPPLFIGGDWEFSAPGAGDLVPFTVPFRMLPPLEITNFAELQTIHRSEGTTLHWHADGFLDGDVVRINILGPSLNNPLQRVSIDCLADAMTGIEEIPASLLEQMGSTPATLLMLTTYPADNASYRFSIELPGGGVAPGSIGLYGSVGFPVSVE